MNINEEIIVIGVHNKLFHVLYVRHILLYTHRLLTDTDECNLLKYEEVIVEK